MKQDEKTQLEQAQNEFLEWTFHDPQVRPVAKKRIDNHETHVQASEEYRAALRAEDAENDFHSRQAEQIRQSTERVEARAVRS